MGIPERQIGACGRGYLHVRVTVRGIWLIIFGGVFNENAPDNGPGRLMLQGATPKDG